MAKSKNQTKFPRELFVHIGEPGTENEYLNADDTTDGIDNDAPVAIYELREIKKMRVTRTLETPTLE